ncbi:membrane protein [Streptomyces sp. MMG1121]|nr:membrane protein [Streptomyces sp. MMG1121]
MSLHSTAAQLATLAESEGGHHNSLNPAITGGGAFIVLLLLLWITTRFNRDR